MTFRRSISACAATTFLLAMTAAMVGATVPANAATKGRELKLTFNSGDPQKQTGVSKVVVRTLSAHDGEVTVVEDGSNGTGESIRLPAYATSNAPMAALSVVDESGADDLSPGTARFRITADFKLDARSSGTSEDNGDNLFQRGGFNDDAQYKLQVDGGVPSCRVKGADGAVKLSSKIKVASDEWYRASCLREDNTLTLKVVRQSDKKKWRTTTVGDTGALDFAAKEPVAVGAKLDSAWKIDDDNSDQFNGSVDRVILNIATP